MESPKIWQFVTATKNIPTGKHRCFTVGEHSIIICCVYREIYAVKNLCPHLNKPLERGRLQEYELSCPFHNAVFDIRDGKVVTGPSVWPATTYPVEIRGDDIYVDLSESGAEQGFQDPRWVR